MKTPLLKWIGTTIAFLALTGIVLAGAIGLTGPTPTAQVGAAYSSAITCGGCVGTTTFSIYSGSLPPGLTLTGATGAITGTPTTAGTYTFTVQASDSYSPPADAPATSTAAQRKGLAQSGSPAANYQATYSITVAGVVAGVPMSPWTLALVMIGLAFAGMFQLRRQNA